MKNTLSPIAIFCFKRFDLLKKLLHSLKKNKECKKYSVIFFSDNGKNNKDKNDVERVRKLINHCNFFKKKTIILRKKNYGLKKNIISGINYIFETYNKIIVLEDDLEVSKNFLKTISILLNKYQNNKSVNTISAYSFPSKKIKEANINKKFFLLKRPSSWGWATWRHKWVKINNIKIRKNKKISAYGNDLAIMAIKKEKRILNSWAYDWTVRHILGNKFCIYPKFSMIKNNGFDNLATNNLLKSKVLFSNKKNTDFKNYFYQPENDKIKNISNSNYSMSAFMFLIKFIYFNLFYGKSKKK